MTIVDSPVFVFVPGAWHTPDTFDGIRSQMAQQGLTTEAIAIPSVGASTPLIGLHADIDHTKLIIEGIVNAGRQVVLVLHSYGGVVGASAVEGLGYTQRSKAGLVGGVIMVVWLAAFVTPKGKSLLDMLGGNWHPWMLLKNDDGYIYSSEQESVLYHDLEPEAQQKCIEMLKPHSILFFTEAALYESWYEILSMYLFCDADKAMPLAIQEAFAKKLKTSVTYHSDGSHSAFLSQPDQVIEELRVALKAGREQNGISVE